MAAEQTSRGDPAVGPSAGLIAIQVGVLILVGFLTPLYTLTTWGGDLYYYQDVGAAFLTGRLPYVSFPFAYPPLAILPMALPALVAPRPEDMEVYRWLFLVQNAAISVAIALSLFLLAGRSWGLGGAAGIMVALVLPLVAIAPLVAWRYDIFVGVFLALALVATAAGRPALAGVALALGALSKVYPAFLLPVFLVRHLARGERAEAMRLVAAFVVTGAAVMVPLLLLAGADALSFVTFQLERGVQLESVPAGITLLAHLVLGMPVEQSYAYMSQQVISPLADALTRVGLVVLVVLLAALMGIGYRSFQAAREPSEDRSALLVGLLLAALLAVIVTNKVLSPQYLIWLLPLVALRPLREALFLAIVCGLSLLIFPLNYERLVDLDPDMIVLLNVRNGLLVAWLGWLVARLVMGRTEDARAP